MKTHFYKLIASAILITVVACMSLLGSCASTINYVNKGKQSYTTSINSFGNYNLVGKTFYIESGDKDVSSSDPEFREYADYVATTLKLQGATETQDKLNADMCILVNYAISDESYTETIPIPIWGQTGIASINTRSTTTGSAYGSAYGNASVIGNSIYGQSSGSVYGSSTTNTTTQVNPTYGVTGYNNVTKRVSKYSRVLNIYAYDNKQTSSATMLWKTNLISFGNSNNLRNVVPYMAFMAFGAMGNNCAGSYTIAEDDPYFLDWRNGTLNLNQPKVTIFPKVSSTNVSNSDKRQFSINMVEKTGSETIVIFCKSGGATGLWYRISPKTYIEYAGNRYYIKSADNYELGWKINNEYGTRYFRLHFPAIPADAHIINIREDVENGWEWNGMQIK